MNQKRITIGFVIFMFLSLANSGCALLNTALAAGLSYGIYQATQ